AFIVSAYFPDETSYGIYEVTAYHIVKDIFKTTEGVTFKTDGNRTCILIEPPSYAQKYIEPVSREKNKSVPYRFNEMTTHAGRNGAKVMVPIEPTFLYSTFTILDRGKSGYSYIFFTTPDVYKAIKNFLLDSLSKDCGLEKPDAKTATDLVMATIKKFSIWQS
ncbi:MAG: hypothetical protein FWH53_11550, partial [Leptospirales bacterium]|nr:hypothetical protein [Leptospirales bacterium]